MEALSDTDYSSESSGKSHVFVLVGDYIFRCDLQGKIISRPITTCGCSKLLIQRNYMERPKTTNNHLQLPTKYSTITSKTSTATHKQSNTILNKR